MTHPIVELAFWNPGDPGSRAIDALLADPSAPLVRHGLTGIAQAYAEATGAALHPEQQRWADELAAKSLALDGALTGVVPALDALGLPFFVAKGPVIAYRDYPDPRLRPYTDLDVYVPTPALAPARATLAELGYEPVPQVPGPLGGLGRELHGGRFGTVVEVHDHPIDNFQRRWLPATDVFCAHVTRTEICGVSVPVLEPAAHLALQAIHLAAGHRYQKLVLYRDVHGALRRGIQLDRLAGELGAELPLAVITAVLDRLQPRPAGARSQQRGAHRPLVAALTRTDPARWNEYGASVRNLLALTTQPSTRQTAAAAITALHALVPRRGRRAGEPIVVSSSSRGAGRPHRHPVGDALTSQERP